MKPGNKKEQTQAHRTAPDEPDAPLSCSERHRTYSMTRQCTVIPRSGRRGRRFKSCHPDQYSRRSEARTRNGEGLSCCPGSPKGTLRERRRACSASTEATWSPFGNEEAAGFNSCHPDHSRRSLTCGNAVSWARCSHSPAIATEASREQMECRATATGRRTPGRPARRSRPRGTARSRQGPVILRQQRRGLSGPGRPPARNH